jgi:hypothetical protein
MCNINALSHRYIIAALAAFFSIWPDSIFAELIHHYRMDETFQHELVIDAIGSANGTAKEIHKGEAGVLGGMYIFDETGPGFLDIGQSNQNLPTDSFTLAFWVGFSKNGMDEYERLLDAGNHVLPS